MGLAVDCFRTVTSRKFRNVESSYAKKLDYEFVVSNC